jgi:Cu/Ag efflux pump CusA
MEADPPWLHVGLSGPPESNDPALAAVRASPDVMDVLTRRRGDDLDVLARVRSPRARGDAASAIARALARVHGVRYDITSPVGLLARELRVAGARLAGADLDVLREAAEKAARALEDVPGVIAPSAPDARVAPRVSIYPDREALERYGISEPSLWSALEMALRGRVAGQLVEGLARFDVIVRVEGPADPAALEALEIATPNNARVPLARLARVTRTAEPLRVLHDGRVRVVDVLFDAESERALDAARKRLASLPLPAGVVMTIARAGDD